MSLETTTDICIDCGDTIPDMIEHNFGPFRMTTKQIRCEECAKLHWFNTDAHCLRRPFKEPGWRPKREGA